MKKNEDASAPTVPKEYAGLWIAWNDDETEITASGTDFAEVHQQALDAGVCDPILEKVPRGRAIVFC